MFFIGKDLILHGEEDPCAVHQVDDWQAVFHGDLLRPEVLFAGNGEPGAGFNGRIVGYDHALAAPDITQPGHHACCRAAAFFGVHFIAGKGADFEEGFVFVQEIIDPLAGSHFALSALFVQPLFTAAFLDDVQFAVHLGDEQLHAVHVSGAFEGFGIH